MRTSALFGAKTFEFYAIFAFFYKKNFIGTRGSFFAQNLRTIPASAEEQSLKF